MPEYSSTLEYRDVEGFPGYKVSNTGEVWSCRPRNGKGPLTSTWRKLACPPNSEGYPRATLQQKGRYVQWIVGRIVLEAFVGPRPAKHECCHYPDPDRFNNCLENLSWGTRARNAEQMVEHDGQAKGIRNGRAKLTEAQVREIKSKYIRGVFGHSRLAKKFNVRPWVIKLIIDGRLWKHIIP